MDESLARILSIPDGQLDDIQSAWTQFQSDYPVKHEQQIPGQAPSSSSVILKGTSEQMRSAGSSTPSSYADAVFRLARVAAESDDQKGFSDTLFAKSFTSETKAKEFASRVTSDEGFVVMPPLLLRSSCDMNLQVEGTDVTLACFASGPMIPYLPPQQLVANQAVLRHMYQTASSIRANQENFNQLLA